VILAKAQEAQVILADTDVKVPDAHVSHRPAYDQLFAWHTLHVMLCVTLHNIATY
jgi:hypothetical protein